MAKYLLSLYHVEREARARITDEEMRQSWKELQALNDEIRSAGRGSSAVPDTATVVNDAGGETITTDGPFVEFKEHLADFCIIEDLDAALKWASKTSACVRSAIEVRLFRDGEL